MRWPKRRFEVAFDRHLRRKARGDIEHERALYIAAVNSNPSYDGRENQEAKSEQIRSIQEAAQSAIEDLYASIGPGYEPPVDVTESDPLFRAMRKDVAGKPQMEQSGAGAVLIT